MSDKSFGDNTNRNTVKNPLLSTAVTGLSIEDLTHNAVLLPAAPSQTLITRPDQQTGFQTHTLAHSYHEPPNFPSGDANLTTLSSISQTDTYSNVLDSKNIVKNEKTNESTLSATISKAPLKSEDDFDVNEYFARLQGTRYVSAPLHSHLKEDQNSNLQTEENLEEINLNEADKVQEFQQSITADIAQNFSQLPTVLPQVASAVFSSFSNMLSYKSREQTPDSVKPGYQEVQLRPEDIAVPLMGVEDNTVKEVAPPPKEQSIGGTVNYRITTKKKAYAQIPGLSSGETSQSTYNQPFNQSVPAFLTPLENIPITDINRDENIKSIAQNENETYNIFNPVAETKAMEMSSEIKPNLAAYKNCEAYTPFGVKDHFAPTQDTSIQFVDVSVVANASAPYGIQEHVASTLSQDTNIQLTNMQRSNTAIAPPQAANQFVNVPQGPNVPIIPPPPMFSNIPRRDSQPSIGKAILPPSVARRISANHPIIKPQAMPVAFTDNIFVPAPIPDISANQAAPIFGQTSAPSFQPTPGMQSETLPPSSFMPIQTSQHTSALAPSSQPSIYAPKNAETSIFSPNHPPASASSIPFMTPPPVLRPPSFPPTMPQSSIPAPPSMGQASNISTNIENTPISAFNTVPTSIFQSNNSTSEPLIFTPSITEMDPARTAISSVPMFTPKSLPQVAKPQFESTPHTSINVPLLTSNIGLTSSLFTENVSQTQSTTNLPPPPTFFNPNLMQSQNIIGTMDQTTQVNQSLPKNNIPLIPEPNISSEPQISSKPLMEPPKASGSLNFRMTKKRPQYYAGPIEGVGAISNNVKPIISTVDTNTFQGAVFTPKQEIQPFEPNMIAHNVDALASFDISKTVDNIPAYAPFDISKPQDFTPQPEFNTAFDLSRQTTETYEQPKQESKGFGILGSLKSKLSSIDMIKIQSTVTTFFDPAYNEPKTDVAADLDNVPYGTQQITSYGQPNDPTQSSLEISVQNLEQNQQSYSQIYDYKTANNYPLENQYCNAQEQYGYYSRGQNVYPTATSSYYPLYSTTTGIYSDVPVNADATSFSVGSVIVTSEVNTSSSIEVTTVESVPQISSNVSTINTHSDIEVTPKASASISASNNTMTYSQENVNTKLQSIDLQAKIQDDVLSSFSQGNVENVPDVTKDVVVIQQTVQVKPTISQDVTAKSFFENISASKEYKSHINTEDQSLNLDINPQPMIDMKSKVISKPFEEKHIVSSNVLKGYEHFNTTPLSLENPIGTSTNSSSDFKFVDKQKSFSKIQDYPIIETNLIESLSIDAIPIVAVSSVPLFGLSTIIANTSKDLTSLEYDMKKVSLFDVPQTSLFEQNTSVSFFENIPAETTPLKGDTKIISELNIYDTSREVNKEDLEETDNLTAQLIENITSQIQLSNPVEVPLTESDTPVLDRTNFDSNQCAEISHMTDETIDTINVQSATELLDDENNMKTTESINYGWSAEETSYVPTKGLVMDHDYTFQINPDTIGFFGDNSLFFENVPNNASDEIKAEFKNTHDDVIPRQMSIPSAPPAEEDSKSDENGGLDVHSIEQDAKNDFPIDEFVIEPSETDDDKIEFKEREKSSDDPVQDTFTNRVERFKKMEICGDSDEVFETQKNYSLFDLPTKNSPAISIASYFDTGNYAAETHYRNSISSPTTLAGFNIGNPEVPLRIPPGFEEEFKRRLSELSTQDSQQITELNNRIMLVPETTTQTKLTYTPTFSSSSDTKPEIVKEIESNLNELVSETPPIFKTKYLPSFSSVFSVETGNKSDDTSDTKPDIVKEIESKLNELVSETPPIFKTDSLPGFSSKYGANTEKISGDISPTSAIKIEPPAELVKPTALRDEINFFKTNMPEKQETLRSLPDPSNFFSSNEPTTSGQEAEGLSRLASYFSMPPSKPDHSKSFFELSQSQNHYRHDTKDKEKIENDTLDHKFNIPSDIYVANLNLMKDLTSLENFEVPKDQVIRPVNYFTIEYDMMTEINNGEPTTCKNVIPEELAESEINDEMLDSIINKCLYCSDTKNQIKVYDFLGGNHYKFRKVSDNTETGKNSERKMDQNKDSNRRSVSVDFSNYIQGENHEGATMLNENRSASEYVPVKHHWFYRVDVEDSSIWRGFSVADSKALETAFISADLNEQTVVATDGGRYDVNVKGRLRIPVYWTDKPTNVRRCSWFYKGTTDARYVPYREDVAIILEEEYRRGITTGEWHRQLVLPDNEMVVMHSPSVMVHFLHSENNDAFSSPPLFTFGKRVYRNPPKIKVSHDIVDTVDHLLLLVHGAGEYRNQKEKTQSTSRPRVVRRGCDESEIEDTEPSSIDHLLLLCHGVGSACDMRFRNVEEVVEDFRATSFQLLQSHYRNSYDNGTVNRVEVLPISWHDTLHSGETGVDRRLAQVTLDSIPRLRNFTNDTVLDVLFYTSPVFCQTILNTVCNEMNRIYNLFKKRNPSFSGGVSIGGHSLGSVILYDLLCHQMPMDERDCQCAEKNYVTGSASTGQPTVKYPILSFSPASMYALGSPIAIFECIRGVESLGMQFSLPTCRNFFNIFHPYDPIAYRIEPLINSQLRDVKPFLIPHHKGRKRMHLELKDTMARVGADLKQKLVESLRATWNKWKAQPPPNDGQLEKVVEEELEKEQLNEDGKDETLNTKLATPDMLGKLNDGRRVDYVLQEAPLEMINEYLFAMSSHVGYWESEDTMLLILREIYDSMGVQPDCTVPQQSMTVQRTRVVTQDGTVGDSGSDYPSTSHGGT